MKRGSKCTLDGVPQDIIVLGILSGSGAAVIGINQDLEELDVANALLEELMKDGLRNSVGGADCRDPTIYTMESEHAPYFIRRKLTDRDKQSLVCDSTNGVLEMVENHRGQDGPSGSRLSSDGQSLQLLALQETGQVRRQPEAGHFLTVLGKLRDSLSDIGQRAVFGR